jgi:DNA polymerase lambda
VSHAESGEHKKYMGVCRLPGPGRLHRRLDIIVVPYGEFACSLMYFTGSAHFNRSEGFGQDKTHEPIRALIEQGHV